MCLFLWHLMPIFFLSVLGLCFAASALYSDVCCMRNYPKTLYLSRSFESCRMALLYFLSFRWNGSDVLLYGGLHTCPFVYLVDPFACRLRRPYRSRWIGSGWDGRKVYP